jgi:hypothetical protein
MVLQSPQKQNMPPNNVTAWMKMEIVKRDINLTTMPHDGLRFCTRKLERNSIYIVAQNVPIKVAGV